MKIVIGSDHGGYQLKSILIEELNSQNIDVIDVGSDSSESVDYPLYSNLVCKKIQSNNADLGILICGTGIGMSIAANKQKGIRAAVVGDVFSAEATRMHNDTNVLCIGARVTGDELAKKIMNTWIHTDFEGGRHLRRINMF